MRKHLLFSVLVVASALNGQSARAALPEPPITFYGTVVNTVGNRSIPVTTGSVAWQFKTAGNVVIRVEGVITQSDVGTFYRVQVPARTIPSGFSVEAGTVDGQNSSGLFKNTVIKVNGNLAQVLNNPGQLGYTAAQRGKTARIDLVVPTAFTDSDKDGLPDWFEDLYPNFDKNNPNDALGDLNGDGISNLEEYRNGTDPVEAVYTYARWAADHQLLGPAVSKDADPDLDGVVNFVEFALDTDPNVPDKALVQTRAKASRIVVGKKTLLQMEVDQPALRRAGIRYVIESASIWNTWKPAKQVSEGLKLTASDGLPARGTRQRLLRLRIENLGEPSVVFSAGIWGMQERRVAGQRLGQPGVLNFSNPFEFPVLAQGQVSGSASDSIIDDSADWAADQWTTEPYLLTLVSGPDLGRTFLIASNGIQTIGAAGLGTQDLGVRFEIRAAPTLASTFGNPPAGLAIGTAEAGDLVNLWNGSAFDSYHHDGNSWLKVGTSGSASLQPILPGSGIRLSRKKSRSVAFLSAGIVADGPRSLVLSGRQFLGSGFPRQQTLLQTGIGAIAGWSPDDKFVLPLGLREKSYSFDGLHWRTPGSPRSMDALKLAPGLAFFIEHAAGDLALIWTSVP